MRKFKGKRANLDWYKKDENGNKIPLKNEKGEIIYAGSAINKIALYEKLPFSKANKKKLEAEQQLENSSCTGSD